jgi:hypothetical protein
MKKSFILQARDRSLEAAACGALGLARRLQRRLDAALGHHTQVSFITLLLRKF